MGSKAPLQITLIPSQDYLLIQWMKIMSERRPRYASVYAREALRHYILTQEYLNIGSVVPIESDQLPQKKQILAIIKDDTISEWVDSLASTKMKAGPFSRAILSKCVLASEDGQNHIPELIDIIEKGSLAEKLVVSSTLRAEPESTPPAVQSQTNSPAGGSAPSPNLNQNGDPKQIANKTPDNPKKQKSSLINRIGAKLE